MTGLQILAICLFGLLVVYLVARLITAAYFKSKQQYEQQRKDHGTQSKQPS